MADTTTQIAIDAVAAITSSTTALTNFNTGSGIRSLIDAFSAEAAVIEQEIQDQFASAVLNVLQNALGVTNTDATGSVYLETFSLVSSAVSSVTLAEGTAVTIPSSSLQWILGQSITIAPGDSVLATVACSTAGNITNVPANSITQLVVPVAGVTVTNASSQPVVQGQDAASQTQVQAQVSNASARLQRGINQSIESAALTSELTDASGNPTEQVLKARYLDALTPAVGYCYVYNGSGPMSSALLTQTTNIIYGYVDTDGTIVEGFKPAGSTINVVDAPETPVSVSVQVLPSNGLSIAAVQTGVLNAIEQYFINLDLGQAVSVQQLSYAILAVPGVADVLPVSPASSLPAIPLVAVPSAPTLTAITPTTATDLVAGTYTVTITFTNPWGETTDSVDATVTLTAGQAIQVNAVTLPTGATGVNYYLSVSAGSTTVAFDTSSAGVATTLTTLPVAGAASPPSSNTAQINGNAYVLSGTPVITAMGG